MQVWRNGYASDCKSVQCRFDPETKVAQAEAQSATLNTQLVEITATKTQVVRERGRDIVKYVDREVVKYDTTCVIPKEFVTVHNRAAEAPKK